MSNCKTIAICNQKGGVGKTTTTVSSYDLSPLISVSGLFLFLPLLHPRDVIGAFFVPERRSEKFF